MARISSEVADAPREPRGWPSGRRRGRPRRSGQSTRCTAERQSSARRLVPARDARGQKAKVRKLKKRPPSVSAHLLGRDGPLRRLAELLDRPRVVPEVLLAANEDDGQVRAEVEDLGDPLQKAAQVVGASAGAACDCTSRCGRRASSTHLLLDVVERVGRVDREADEDDVGVRVRERPQPVVVLLAGSIPKGELDLLTVDLDVCGPERSDSVEISERFREQLLTAEEERRTGDVVLRTRTGARSAVEDREEPSANTSPNSGTSTGHAPRRRSGRRPNEQLRKKQGQSDCPVLAKAIMCQRRASGKVPLLELSGGGSGRAGQQLAHPRRTVLEGPLTRRR